MLKATLVTSLALASCASAAHAQLYFPANPEPTGFVTLVGVSANGQFAAGHAGGNSYLWPVGQPLQPIGTLPGYPLVRAFAISADGTTIVGSASEGAIPNAEFVPFMWSQTTGLIQLDYAPSTDSPAEAFAVSGDGSVAFGHSGLRAARWTAPDQPELIAGLEDFHTSYLRICTPDGQFAAGVGDPIASGPNRLLYWSSANGLTDLGVVDPFYDEVFPTGISDDGTIIVGNAVRPSSGQSRGFRWTESTGFVLYSDPFVDSEITGLAPDGVLMTGRTPLTNNMYAVLNPDGNGTPLNDFADQNNIDRDGWNILFAGTISADNRTYLGTARKGTQFSHVAIVLPCPSDYNADGTSDILDFLDYIEDFSACSGLPTPCGTLGNPDLTGDGLVDILDLLIFLDAFSAGC
jgi:uncharacterized membrane protein